MTQLREIRETDDIINGIACPVELTTLPGGMQLNELQISVNVITPPNTNKQFLAADFINILNNLKYMGITEKPDDSDICEYLMTNLCKPTNDPFTLKVRPEKYQLVCKIIDTMELHDFD